MNKKNTEYLYKTYPKLFIQHKLPPKKTCMCWDICCGDGWFNILDETCKKLELLKKQNKKAKIKLEFFQIKEKFGELRIYYNLDISNNDYKINVTFAIDKIIEEAIQKSPSICELCGSLATKTTKPYIRHLCKKCYEKQRKESK